MIRMCWLGALLWASAAAATEADGYYETERKLILCRDISSLNQSTEAIKHGDKAALERLLFETAQCTLLPVGTSYRELGTEGPSYSHVEVRRNGATAKGWVLSHFIRNAQGTVFSLYEWMGRDDAFKQAMVAAWIEHAKEKGITMRLPVEYYVAEIDSLAENTLRNGDTEGLHGSFSVSLKTIAIMDCDFDDGVSRYKLARRYFGEENLAQMAQRFPQKIARLRAECPPLPDEAPRAKDVAQPSR